MTRDRSEDQLHRDFDRAMSSGRWLSDEEMQLIAKQEQDEQISLEQAENNRRKLIALTLVCVLLPPLWPVALLLTLVLLYPSTMKRIGLFSSIIFMVIALVSTLGLLAVMIWVVGLLT